MKKVYNKLVRDKIPEIIKLDNCKPTIRTLDSKEFLSELFKKMAEEAEEFVKAKDNKEEVMKEITDIYEIIDTVIRLYGLDKNDILALQEKRRDERGSFKNMVYLESVDENK